MFNFIYKLLRSKCFNCNKLKIKDTLIIYFYLKLSLIKLGYLSDAKYLDSLIYSKVCPNSNILGSFRLILDIINEFFKNKDFNFNFDEMTVSTDEANTTEMIENTDNTDEMENEEEEKSEQSEENVKIKKSKKKKQQNKNNKEGKNEFAEFEKPLTDIKIINITKILDKLTQKVENYENDLNIKIMLK